MTGSKLPWRPRLPRWTGRFPFFYIKIDAATNAGLGGALGELPASDGEDEKGEAQAEFGQRPR
jgi:hypothetical protein